MTRQSVTCHAARRATRRPTRFLPMLITTLILIFAYALLMPVLFMLRRAMLYAAIIDVTLIARHADADAPRRRKTRARV